VIPSSKPSKQIREPTKVLFFEKGTSIEIPNFLTQFRPICGIRMKDTTKLRKILFNLNGPMDNCTPHTADLWDIKKHPQHPHTADLWDIKNGTRENTAK
jgi:hypothetical protein